MVVIFNTKDRESDIVLWNEYRLKNLDKSGKINSYECSEDKDLQFFLEAISNISMFTNESSIIVAHNLTYSKDISKLIETSSENIILVTPKGRWSSYKGESTKYTKSISDNQIKNDILDVIKNIISGNSKIQISNIYNAITVKSYSGKDKLSPIMAQILIRRIKAIDINAPQERKELELGYIISQADKHINQWKVIDFIFSNNKQEQYNYFSQLTKTVSPFELIAQIKSTLFLLRVLSDSVEKGLDSSSIAKKLNKHPFYISSIMKTLKQYRVTNKKLELLVLRFLKLEFMLKSGRFEDEQFGFEILLATI